VKTPNLNGLSMGYVLSNGDLSNGDLSNGDCG